MKMPVKTIMAITVAIVLFNNIAASAATSCDKTANHQVGVRAHTGLIRVSPLNLDDPISTGGGSLGYNQNIYNW
jgi:hypothetical protein